MSVDTIGDFLTIIRNGIMASKPYVLAPHSKVRLEIAKILENEGFIREFSVVDDDKIKTKLKIVLKYVNGESVIHDIHRVSTPGRRNYVGKDSIRPVIDGLGVSILTTSKGFVTGNKAKELDVGGEVVCTVW